MNIRQFNAQPHPYWLPNFIDGINWSLPFVGEKITQVFMNVLNICSDDELGDTTDEDLNNKKLALQKKIKAVAKMAHYFHTMREESETVLQLKGLSPNGTLPAAIMDEGSSSWSGVRGKIGAGFSNSKILDKENERMPSVKNVE